MLICVNNYHESLYYYFCVTAHVKLQFKLMSE